MHDGGAYATVVGEVLDPRYSTYPVLAILRGNPYLILTADRYRSPWGSEIQIRSRGAAMVLVDQAAEQILSANVSWAHSNRGLVFRHRCRKSESAMGPSTVVMLGIRPER